ncbi:hypothetical protein QQ045_016772 [Rhodiola kirilowii]
MVDAGLIYWEMGKTDEGMALYKRAAVLGDPAGQCNLAISYLKAEPPNLTEAVKWLVQSSHAGYVRAQYQLALCLHQGQGVDRNLSEAVRWYLKAAEGGHIRAMYNISLCYSLGEGSKADSFLPSAVNSIGIRPVLKFTAPIFNRENLFNGNLSFGNVGLPNFDSSRDRNLSDFGRNGIQALPPDCWTGQTARRLGGAHGAEAGLGDLEFFHVSSRIDAGWGRTAWRLDDFEFLQYLHIRSRIDAGWDGKTAQRLVRADDAAEATLARRFGFARFATNEIGGLKELVCD